MPSFCKATTAVLLVTALAVAQSQSTPHWVGSWASAQQLPEPQNSLPEADLHDATLRQTVHLSLGGASLRVRLSNTFGAAPLHLNAVHIARPGTTLGSIDPATDTPLTFSNQPDVTIPAGADYLSDPVPFAAPPLSSLTVTMHFDAPPAQQTGHPGSRATSFLAPGNHVADATLPAARPIEHWYQLAAVEVAAPPNAASIVTLGDSITDGHGATTDADNRWPDILARKLQRSPATRNLGVLNLGIGGNRVLLDGLGPNAAARIDRDVLAQSGVRFLILLEGVNDLGVLTREHDASSAGHQAIVRQIFLAYQQILAKAHAHNIQVIGATILPYTGSAYYHPAAPSEADRQAINAWIRTPGHFDHVLDFDRLLANPASPTHLAPAYDSGDHLHPSAAGYRVMGEAIPAAFFTH